MRLSPGRVVRLISYWPPFLAAGIRVEKCANDLSLIQVSLKQKPWTKNYFGTHFGGSLFSMTDPFFLFILMDRIGKEHIVWDLKTEIEFVKALSCDVFADFSVSDEQIEEIKQLALENFRTESKFFVEVKDASGQVAAKVTKTLYIRRKDAKERFRN